MSNTRKKGTIEPQKIKKNEESDDSYESEEEDNYQQAGFSNNFFCVNKIIKERKLKNGEEQVYVSWKGWGSKENSWVYKNTLMEFQSFLELETTTGETTSSETSEISNAEKLPKKILVEQSTQSDYDSYEPLKKKKRKGEVSKGKVMKIIKEEKPKIESVSENDVKEEETMPLNNPSFLSNAPLPAQDNSSSATDEELLLDGLVEAAFEKYFFSRTLRETKFPELWTSLKKDYPDLFTSFKTEAEKE